MEVEQVTKKEVFDVKAELEKPRNSASHEPDESESRPQFGIKRRNKDERTKNTAKQLELMRKKQAEHEIKRRGKIPWSAIYVSVGIAVGVVGVGIGIFRLFFT